VRIQLVVRSVADPWNREALASALRARGHEVETAADGELAGDGVALLAGSPTWYPRTVERVLRAPAGQRPRLLVWQTEPLALPPAAGVRDPRRTVREWGKVILRDVRRSDTRSNLRVLAALQRAGRLEGLGVCTGGWQETLALEGIPSMLVPLGAGPHYGRLLGGERGLGVVFLGNAELPYRRAVIRRVRRDGLEVEVAGSWRDPVQGDRRTQLLNRAAIALNVARAPKQLAAGRFLLGMVNGALVVSDPVYAPEPFVPGIHFVEAPVDGLATTCRHWLDDPAGRARITAAAHALVMQELTLENVLARLVALVDDASASPQAPRS
jgi:hypothetical protein